MPSPAPQLLGLQFAPNAPRSTFTPHPFERPHTPITISITPQDSHHGTRGGSPGVNGPIGGGHQPRPTVGCRDQPIRSALCPGPDPDPPPSPPHCAPLCPSRALVLTRPNRFIDYNPSNQWVQAVPTPPLRHGAWLQWLRAPTGHEDRKPKHDDGLGAIRVQLQWTHSEGTVSAIQRDRLRGLRPPVWVRDVAVFGQRYGRFRSGPDISGQEPTLACQPRLGS